MKKDEHIFHGRCRRRRGCEVDPALPHDKFLKLAYMQVYGSGDDTEKVFSLADISLDKELEKEGQMEKMAA